MTVASDPELKIVKIPTPSLVINRITGGGFALGRHVELYGDPSVGKSTIMYGTMAMSQRRGKLCGLVDPEGVFDPEWYMHLGGYPDELLYSRPDTAEEIIGSLRLLVEKATEGAEIEVVGIDSQSAMVTKEQVEKDPTEEERVASQARMMSRALRVLTMRNRRVLFIWTNQLRSNIGFGAQFNPHVTSGGRAMGFYATTRIEFKKTGAVEIPGRRADKGEMKAKKIKVGDWIQVRSQKEKSARPYAQGAYIFRSDQGHIDLGSEIVQLGLEDEIIDKSGNSYTYETLDGMEFKAGSFTKFCEKLMEDAEVREEIISAIEDMTFQLARVSDYGA
jgi:recombination protein RecA